MPCFTYQVGEGSVETGTLTLVAHSTMIVAPTVADAAREAKGELGKNRAWPNANVARLLDEDSMIVWFRPVPKADRSSPDR